MGEHWVAENVRRWYRPKKYKPQHRKQKMLSLRYGVKKLSSDQVFFYIDKMVSRYEKRIRSGWSIYLLVGADGYKAQDVFRAIRSIHKDLVRRLSNLVVYWVWLIYILHATHHL